MSSINSSAFLPSPAAVRRSRTLVVLVFLSAVLVSLVVTFSVLSFVRFRDDSSALQYAILIDAGSSSSKIHAYSWPYRDGNEAPVLQPEDITQESCQGKNPGINAFVGDSSGLAQYMDSIFLCANPLVPSSLQSSTVFYLYATAGMRVLPISQQNAIISEIRSLAKDNTSFRTTVPDGSESSIAVIPGSYEGLWGFITLNYLLKNLGIGQQIYSPLSTVGALDLGGQSTQITFYPQNPSELPANYSLSYTIDGHPASVYAYSYLNNGRDAAARTFYRELFDQYGKQAFLPNPCLQTGLFENMTLTNGTFVRSRGVPNDSLCTQFIQNMLQKPPCPFSHCGLYGQYQPPLRGDFYAFSNYYYTASFLNISGRVQLSQFESAAKSFCAMNGADLLAKYRNNRYLSQFCFNAMYIYNLLTIGYGFSGTSYITFIDSIGGKSIGWALGAVLERESLVPGYGPPKIPAIALPTGYILLGVFSFFSLVTLVLLTITCIRRSNRDDESPYRLVTN